MFGWFKNFTKPSELRDAGVMGMNRRNYHVISRLNKRSLYPLVDDKVQTKTLAHEHGINTTNLIGVIEFQHEVKDLLEMVKKHKSFVVKPAHGSGGKGIMVICSYDENNFITPSGKSISYKELYQHISNILSGLYSLGGKYDKALIEEMINFSPVFKNLSYQGVPDVRVIVYRGYPVMSMIRLSTAASGGRANLHQGAVGVGLDIKTGKALKAVMRDEPITHHPDTGVNLLELQIPLWEEHLKIAAQAYEMTGLGYIGADIVLDEKRGPMLLELNARPGLAIQIANGKGLANAIKKIDKQCKTLKTWEERVRYTLDF